MSVLVGSARSSYGNTSPGDQAGGNEVSTQNWYLHKLGWVALIAKSKIEREMIADAMAAACKNDLIGYDQDTRSTLTNAIKDKGYDPAKCTKKVNTDCSELTHVCCEYAGIHSDSFTTSSLVDVLMRTGKFDKFTSAKYCESPDYLPRGTILCTKTKGHVVVTLTDGAKVESTYASEPEVVQPVPSTNRTLIVRDGKWNVRSAPNKDADPLRTVHGGDVLTIADEQHWIPVVVGTKIGWISSKAVVE